MTQSPERDPELSRLLNAVDRVEASPEFTDRVMERLERSSRKRSRHAPWVLVPAAAALVLGLALARQTAREREAERRAAARVERMRNEYRALELELERLRALAREAEPVMDLGGTEDVGFVLDLQPLIPASAEVIDDSSGLQTEPASLRRR